MAQPARVVDPPPADLFHYLSAHQVLICKQCHYAVQKQALPRHLKEIHRITRSRRNPFLEYALRLDIAEPEYITLPKGDQFPVPFLPVEEGHACKAPACDHLCVTAKRMKAHWTAIHHRQPQEIRDYVKVFVQTFFRGNQLKYFTGATNYTYDKIKESQKQSLRRSPSTQVTSGTRHASSFFPTSSSCAPLGTPEAYKEALLNHFVTETASTISQDSRTLDLWRATVPQLALKSAFLMDGILACASRNVAHLRPERHNEWLMQAANFQDQGIPKFQWAIANVNDANCSAVYAAAHMLIVNAFASEQGSYESHYFDDVFTDTGLPCWLHFLRGGCSMLCDYMEEVGAGPMKPLVEIWQFPIHEEGGEIEKRFQEIFFKIIPSLSSSSLPVWPQEEVEIYKDAASKLATALQHNAASQRALLNWEIFHIWLMQVSDEFLELLIADRPGPLILLAHYCILIKELDQHWFMEGCVRRLLCLIHSRLDAGWKVWIEGVLYEIEGVIIE